MQRGASIEDGPIATVIFQFCGVSIDLRNK
uniref:Uncharacterized protein n=1 Tax=Arundo donax TaxID=35708 RepID=A0A0A9C9D2_ARUDO